jgi:hypothetical protein
LFHKKNPSKLGKFYSQTVNFKTNYGCSFF